MYDEGYKKSYNIDFARNVIHYMKQKNKRLRSSMIFETMNALDIEYEDEQFDIIFDKATFDCILCDIQANKKAKIYMDEIYRLLKPKGYFFMISNSEPENRNKYLLKKGYKFNILVHKIENDEKDVKYFDMLDYNLNYLKKTHYFRFKIIPFIPKSIDYANYADKNYWLQRYENVNCSYEWYDDYETIKPIISDLNLPKRCVIIDLF